MVTSVSWLDPTKNTDGTAVVAGEITGYTVGVRLASGTAGTYAWTIQAPATATSELLSLITPALPTGVALASAVQANTAGPSSAWSNEVSFTLPVPPPIPDAPSNFSVA